MKAVQIDWGKRCKSIRVKRGWSRTELGDAVGVSGRTVEGWELHKHSPDKRARRGIRAIWRAIKVEREDEVVEQEVQGDD